MAGEEANVSDRPEREEADDRDASGAPTASTLLGGPVCTRTAERSLHVNLVPEGARHCNLDCLYCPFPRAGPHRRWPRPGDLGAAVMNALHDAPDIDSITVSGPGDPTLHPGFGRALGDVLSARRVREDLPVRVVTNAWRLLDPHVRRLLGFVDERIVRIDAGGERIARPRDPASLHELRMALGELADFSIEAVFVEGPDGNANPRDVDAWLDLVSSLGPKRVYVTTSAEAPLEPGTHPASPGMLGSIAARLHARTGRSVTVVP